MEPGAEFQPDGNALSDSESYDDAESNSFPEPDHLSERDSHSNAHPEFVAGLHTEHESDALRDAIGFAETHTYSDGYCKLLFVSGSDGDADRINCDYGNAD